MIRLALCPSAREMMAGDDSMQLQYVVNPAGFSDWPGLHRLLNECFAYMDGRIDPPSSLTRMTPEVLREKAGDETLVVVYSDEDLVACGFLRETDQTIYIGKLAVRPSHRKREYSVLSWILQRSWRGISTRRLWSWSRVSNWSRTTGPSARLGSSRPARAGMPATIRPPVSP